MMRVALIIALSAGAALAEDREAPAYYLDEIVAVTTAQRLADFCADVDFAIERAVENSGLLIERLEADGFDTGTATLGMKPSGAEILKRQDAFMAKHDMSLDDPACRAAKIEIAEKTAIGGYLKEVAK